MKMKTIYIKNFRCFGKEQAAQLAPLTLLVGENGAGKTAFLTMVRALWKTIVENGVPDFGFEESASDMGAFDDIVHRGRGKRPQTFEAGFDTLEEEGESISSKRFFVVFGRDGVAPVPVRRRLGFPGCRVLEKWEADRDRLRLCDIQVDNSCGEWSHAFEKEKAPVSHGMSLPSPAIYLAHHLFEVQTFVDNDKKGLLASNSSYEMTDEERSVIEKAIDFFFSQNHLIAHPYVGAPVRVRPRRTHEPELPAPDPIGGHVPGWLSASCSEGGSNWESFRKGIEEFGRESGLFDELSIRYMGRSATSPFQVMVRKHAGKGKGKRCNLIDAGNGTGQSLPVVAELLRPRPSPVVLLQQPETGLHQRAQDAMGRLLCRVAGPQSQLVVETHSETILDRVRMDIRDGAGSLKPEDVSILFFEREATETRIHSISIDRSGYLCNAPEGYKKFFIEEPSRRFR